MVYETDSIPSYMIDFDIDWRDLDEGTQKYFKKKFNITDENRPLYVSIFNGNVSIMYRNEV